MTPTRTEFLHLPVWQQVLFYVLVVLSLGVMAFQVVQRVKLWRQGKPIDWKPQGLRALWANVLLQRKVRSARRRSGAPMHLMLFYGFLALFLATTLLAIATYSPWKFHQGTYYLAYELTFDVLGLLFVIGCGWALVRRLWFRPANVANESADTWALLLLFVLGLTGYVLEAARIGNDPKPWDAWSPIGYAVWSVIGGVSNEAYVAIWWFHIVWVLVFFSILPRMRIRHLLMAVASTYGMPAKPWGELSPITMEEVEATGQIGVASAKDYSRWHLMSLDACMECGRCTDACPANGVGKVLNPKKIVQDIRGALVSGAAVAEAVSEEALWQCTTCSACVEACPVSIRHVDLIVDARRNLIAEGKFSGTGAVMLRQVGSTSHGWGQPASSREDWMRGFDIPLCRDGAEFDVLLWVGCAGATDPGAVRTTQAVAKLLQRAGVKFACLGQEEACTGDPARRTGDEFLFQEKALANVSVFERYGVRRIVTPCPHCFNSLHNEYSQFGGQIEVEHHTQLLARLVAEGKLVAANPDGTVLHDPCYLARLNGESSAPRTLAGKGRSWIEPENRGVKTLCCGAGGGRMWMEEPADQRPGNRRAQELLSTGATQVAVACPFCRIMLDASLKQVTEDEIRLVDLAELMAERNAGP